jgi:hypothetical protein
MSLNHTDEDDDDDDDDAEEERGSSLLHSIEAGSGAHPTSNSTDMGASPG